MINMKIQKFVNEFKKDKYCGDKLLLLLQYQPDIRWPITSPSSGSKMGWILPESDSNFKKRPDSDSFLKNGPGSGLNIGK